MNKYLVTVIIRKSGTLNGYIDTGIFELEKMTEESILNIQKRIEKEINKKINPPMYEVKIMTFNKLDG